MPVQNIGSDVISAFLAGRRLKQEKEAREQDLQLRQQQFEESTRQFQQQLQERKRQFDAENAVRQAQFNLGIEKAKPEFTKAMIQGLFPSQRRRTGEAIPLPDIGTEIPIEELVANIPGIGELKAPTPEAFAQTQRTLQRPATDEAIRRTVAAFEGTIPGRERLARTQGEEQRKTLAIRNKQAEVIENLRAQNAFTRAITVADISGQYRLAAAQIARQNRDVDPDELEATAEFVAKGDAPRPAGKLGVAVDNVLAKKGHVPVLPKEAQGMRNDVAKAHSVIQQLEDFVNNNKNAFGGIAAKGKGEFEKFVNVTEFGNQLRRLQASMGNLTSSFGGESGARLSDADRKYMESFSINTGISAQANIREINKLKAIVNRTMNTRFGNLKSEQRQSLFDTANIPYLRSSQGLSPEKKVKNITVVPD